jgi:hypothetical protein
MFTDFQSLIANQFIIASEKYRRWVSDHAREAVSSDSRRLISVPVGAGK